MNVMRFLSISIMIQINPLQINYRTKARDGFKVGPHLAKSIREKEKYIISMPHLGYLLTKNNDGVTLLKEGDTMIRIQYAKTLEAIMSGGGDVLYHGDLASMLAKVRAELDLFI